jgi:DNA-binding NtrC family response regulator
MFRYEHRLMFGAREVGAGRGLIARYLHEASGHSGAFLAINRGVIVEES